MTLFGVVDAQFQHVSGDGNGSVNRLHNSGYNSSRLGFRRVEDLGGGLSASFWLEAGIANDDGSAAATNVNNQAVNAFNPATGANAPVRAGTQGLTFNRRSTVSLNGGFGEVRLGRDYTPSFWNHTVFDPFGTNGVGGTSNLSLGLGTTASVQTTVRASNSIGYFLPGNLGGFYGQAQYAFGENASNVGATKNDGRYIGFRVGYANGPLNIAGAYGITKLAALDDYKNANIAGSYNLGVANLMAHWNQEKVGNLSGVGVTNTTYMIGALVPVGAGEFRISLTSGKAKGGGFTVAKGNQIALGYVHNLSKRTALYTTYARISNGNGLAPSYHNGRAATTLGGDTSGFDVGIKHSF